MSVTTPNGKSWKRFLGNFSRLICDSFKLFDETWEFTPESCDFRPEEKGRFVELTFNPDPSIKSVLLGRLPLIDDWGIYHTERGGKINQWVLISELLMDADDNLVCLPIGERLSAHFFAKCSEIARKETFDNVVEVLEHLATGVNKNGIFTDLFQKAYGFQGNFYLARRLDSANLLEKVTLGRRVALAPKDKYRQLSILERQKNRQHEEIVVGSGKIKVKPINIDNLKNRKKFVKQQQIDPIDTPGGQTAGTFFTLPLSASVNKNGRIINDGNEQFGPCLSLVPFLNSNDGVRAQMGANALRHASAPTESLQSGHPALIKSEIPFVRTGKEKDLAELFDAYEKEFCPGNNLITAFLPWYGWNFEDGIVISQEVIEKELLTYQVYHEEQIVYLEGESKLDEEFIKDLSGDNAKLYRRISRKVALGQDGLPVEGTFIDMKKNEIYGFKRKGGMLIKLRWNADTIGTISYQQTKEGVRYICVKLKRPLQIGDKIANRHGNKGVITRIEPTNQMPFFYRNGEKVEEVRIQILLNPFGVVSRRNIGQILETNLGLLPLLNPNDEKAKENIVDYPAGDSGERVRKCLSVHYDKWAENVNGEEQFKGHVPELDNKKIFRGEDGYVSLVIPARDGHDAVLAEKVTVGYHYLVRLYEHDADEKMNARSSGVQAHGCQPYDKQTGQPVGGRRQKGGQRLGEMEVWALEGHGEAGQRLLFEMLGPRSDLVSTETTLQRKLIGDDSYLSPPTEPLVPPTWRTLFYYLLTCGIAIELLDKEKQRLPWPEQDAKLKKVAKVRLKHFPLKTADDLTPFFSTDKESAKITNSWLPSSWDKLKEHSLFSPEVFCKEQEGRIEGLLELPTTGIGYIELNIPIPNPLAVVNWAKDLKVSARLLAKFILGWNIEGEIPSEIKNLCEEFPIRDNIESHIEAITNAKLGEEHLLKVIPVMPPRYRMPTLINRRFHFPAINGVFKKIIQTNYLLGKPDSDQSKIAYYLYGWIERLLINPFDKQLDTRRLKGVSKELRSISYRIFKKEGILRNALLGKRIDFSSRAVISVDPTIDIDRCGLPAQQVLIMFREQVIQKLKSNGNERATLIVKRLCQMSSLRFEYLLRDAESGNKFAQKVSKDWKKAVKVLNEFFPEDGEPKFLVLLNRQPSLNRDSIHAFKPIIHNGNTITINPLVTGLFGADFDGDQMTCYPVLSQENLDYAKQLIPSADILSLASDDNVLNLGMDVKFGALEMGEESISVTSFRNYLQAATTSGISAGVLELLDSANPISDNHIFEIINRGAKGKDRDFEDIFGKTMVGADIEDKESLLGGLSDDVYFDRCLSALENVMKTLLGTFEPSLLGKKLVYAARNLKVTEKRCKSKGIPIPSNLDSFGLTYRFVRKDCETFLLLPEGVEVPQLGELKVQTLYELPDQGCHLLSPLTCEERANGGICPVCAGVELSKRRLWQSGEAIGVNAALSIAERMTQLIISAAKRGSDFPIAKAKRYFGNPVKLDYATDALDSAIEGYELFNQQVALVHFETIFSALNGKNPVEVVRERGNILERMVSLVSGWHQQSLITLYNEVVLSGQNGLIDTLTSETSKLLLMKMGGINEQRNGNNR